jgi:hypothetical protein
MEPDFYVSPGFIFEPGDIFFDVPFPALKHPLLFYRRSVKVRGQAAIFSEADKVTPSGGDSPHAPFTKQTVMLVSHGCELDAVERDVASKNTDYGRRWWLAAPVRRLSECEPRMQERVARGRQPNKFLLPPKGLLGEDAHFVDLRKITPITVPYFQNAQKVCSLSATAISALQAHLCLFFSGRVFYVQPVPCPHCNMPVDPNAFVVDSTEVPDPD